MVNHKFILQNGSEAELCDIDMQNIHEYYELQCTADYIRENYPNLTEEEIQKYAADIRAGMDKYGYSENEAAAIIITKH